MVGTIPVLPSVHILERTAIQLQPEQMTSKTLLDRIFTYLRRNSIVVVQCDQDTGCLECIFRSPTTGSSVEFVIQLWRAVRSHHYHYQQQQYFLWVEIQRRQGCCIEMNSLRRSLIQYIMNGDAQVATEDVFQAQGQRTRPRPALDDMTNESHRKRPKTAPSPAVGVNCQDSLAITLRLLESPYKNQQKLGLESLVISTNAALVSQGNATVVSHALVEGDGPWGGRLQQRLAVLLRQVQPAPRGTGHFPEPTGFYQPGSMAATLYNLALQALANALECLSQGRQEGSAAMDLGLSFWQTAVQSLAHNLEDAMVRPHEAALSAKCIFHLLQLTHGAGVGQVGLLNSSSIVVMETIVQYGKAHHRSLEQEAQKLMGSYNSVRA